MRVNDEFRSITTEVLNKWLGEVAPDDEWSAEIDEILRLMDDRGLRITKKIPKWLLDAPLNPWSVRQQKARGVIYREGDK